MNLEIINSSFSISITLQFWSPDSWLPLMTIMGRNGFTVDYSQSTQPIVYKDTTTFFRIDNAIKRITFQITNNTISPEDNLIEILGFLSSIGLQPDDSIDRIDMSGNIIIKINNGSTSDFVSNVIKSDLSEKIDSIFGRSTRIAGIRIVSSEYHLEDSNKSPFVILIEPLVTDRNKKKFFIQTIFSTSKNKEAINFLKSLYDNLKNVIIELENEKYTNTRDI